MTKPAQRQSGYLAAAILVGALGLAIPAAFENWRKHLGPLDTSQAALHSPIVLDREGRLLRAFTTDDGRWRLPVRAADVDPRFVSMLLAYEDKRFESHGGVDARALVRAAGQFAMNGGIVSGGSTLTMQVARLLEPRAERSLAAKARQMLRARQIEARYSKEQILDLYLSLAPFGGNLEGIRAASFAYFGKEPRRLSFAESALLVALPQSPETRRPDRFAQAARRGRDRVLDTAVGAGLLTREDAELARHEPIPRARLPGPMLAAHLAEEIAGDSKVLVHRLTVDARLQSSLEQLVREAVAKVGEKVTAAVLVIDNSNGAVLAHVGSADYFDASRAGAIDMTRALRSPGSALKPFIYAQAFDTGLAHPETMLEDRPARYGTWAPENFDLSFQGNVTARRALQQSLNIPAAEILSALGPSNFLARLRSAGATLVVPRESAPGLAVGLGGLGVSLRDMARLYAGLARGGAMPDLIWRAGVEQPPAQRLAAGPVASWYVADVLRGAPPPTHALGGRIAFKTGTSYGYRDALSVGFDQRFTIAVWVGRADNGAVPGLIGRQVAAPILFDAYARTLSLMGGDTLPLPRPPGALTATTAQLPPPLRNLRQDAPKVAATSTQSGLKIAYPPDGARVDLGLARVTADDEAPILPIKTIGGAPPFTYFVNGRPLGAPELRRQTHWKPDGAGFARLSVMDSRGVTDSVVVRLE